MSKYQGALGASGAVNGIITWSIMQNPRAIIYLYMVIPVPGKLYMDITCFHLALHTESNAHFLSSAFSSFQVPQITCTIAFNGCKNDEIWNGTARYGNARYGGEFIAALCGALFITKDLVGMYQGSSGVANVGHLGGALAGAAFFLIRR